MLPYETMTPTFDSATLPLRPPHKKRDLGPARGCLDVCEYRDGKLLLAGWLLEPQKAMNSARVYVNGVYFAACPLTHRPDLVTVFSSVKHAGSAGFSVQERVLEGLGDIVRVTVVGYAGTAPTAELEAFYSFKDITDLEPPPPELMKRVSGSDSHFAFRIVGLNLALDLFTVIRQHREITNLRTILDWGCGSGRVSSEIRKLAPSIQLSGCDIDSEAVGWCKKSIPGAVFEVIPPYPPTSFADDSFDLIFGFSVMTHLTRKDQQRWLKEMYRLVRPDGLLIVSVHGEFASGFCAGVLPLLKKSGFSDSTIDPALNGIAPEGYYRGTFQTEAYTRKEWKGNFEVLDYIPGGLARFQDLVVLKPKGKKRRS
jgi:SAM-dependent methyltransferase